MLIDGKTYKTLDLDNLSSLIAFSEWLKSNLSLYANDEKISGEHFKIFLEYIKENAKDQRVSDKRGWLDIIDGLIERSDKA